jgi:hypothetical protein
MEMLFNEILPSFSNEAAFVNSSPQNYYYDRDRHYNQNRFRFNTSYNNNRFSNHQHNFNRNQNNLMLDLYNNNYSSPYSAQNQNNNNNNNAQRSTEQTQNNVHSDFSFTQDDINSLTQNKKPQSNNQIKESPDDVETSTPVALNPPEQINTPLNDLIHNISQIFPTPETILENKTLVNASNTPTNLKEFDFGPSAASNILKRMDEEEEFNLNIEADQAELNKKIAADEISIFVNPKPEKTVEELASDDYVSPKSPKPTKQAEQRTRVDSVAKGYEQISLASPIERIGSKTSSSSRLDENRKLNALINKSIKHLKYTAISELVTYDCWVSYAASPLMFWVQLCDHERLIIKVDSKLK